VLSNQGARAALGADSKAVAASPCGQKTTNSERKQVGEKEARKTIKGKRKMLKKEKIKIKKYFKE
jgi:hypothetical protein